METVSYTAARSKLAKIMDQVCDDHAPITVTRQNARPVVLLALADYQALQETVYLLRSPANAVRLSRSIADVEAGKVAERGLLE